MDNNTYISPSKARSKSPVVSRLSDFLAQKTEKIEMLRKEKIISEIKALQDRPVISQNSKKLIKSHIPLYKRLEQVFRSRYEHKKSLQMQSDLQKRSDFRANCMGKTFSKSPSRTADEFLEQVKIWHAKKMKKQEIQKKKKEDKEDSELTLKPNLSLRTLQLTNCRSLTPVFTRLYEVKTEDLKEESSFRPNVLPESLKLIGKREGLVFDRLYSLRKDVK